MRIGVPREIKVMEFRVGMVPDGVRQLVAQGHEVHVETGAGNGCGFDDDDYVDAGARVGSLEDVWESELVVKVKEPQSSEIARLHSGQTLFTYLHLAAAPEVTQGLLDAGVLAIAYETIRTPDGAFPVLAPMSEVAGRLAAQIGAMLLQKDRQGKGLLLGGVPGVKRGKVTVLGAGTVGINAVRVAHALGAEVDVLDVDLKRLTYLYDIFSGDLNTLYSNPANIARSVISSDLVIGGVYVSGQRAPVVVTEEMVKEMDARRPDLPRTRRGSLRSRQHAGCRSPDVDLRPHEHDTSLRGAAGGPGDRGGAARGSRVAAGGEYLAWTRGLRGRCVLPRTSAYAAGIPAGPLVS